MSSPTDDADRPGAGSGDATTPGPEVGSVAEEAAKLVGALSDWARGQGDTASSGVAGSVAGLADLARDLEGHVAGENCSYCPVCRIIGVVRATSPEVKGHLTTATTALLQAAMSALATQVPSDSRPSGHPVQRIILDEDDASDD